ncbi:hypothetical protein [Labrys monachus]|uniref:DUF155 domain-containing protein n=1 Tax=Labrys monachus TaxID=217067 RepID=A0ABU0FLF5_9HYPH|nr:hypothetical protein [Labrys monachus]MDQ0395442.1 hypothetical protein [Labrys monachus]
MQRIHLVEAPAVEVKAWHVGFTPAAVVGAVEISSPRRLFAQWTSIDAEAPPALSRAPGEIDRSIAILWMPPGAAPQVEEAWLAAMPAADSGARIVRAGLRTARVVWTDRLAIVHTAEELLEDTLDALIRFTVVERDTAALEAKMASVWTSMDVHASLAHTVPSGDYDKRKAEVNKTTEVVAKMAGVALRVEAALEQLDARLHSSSKRLFAELVLQAGLEDRLEMLAEPIDFAIEHYELINTRMIEAKHFMVSEQQFEADKKQFEIAKKQGTASLVIELVILAVLVADLLLIAYPYITKWSQ